MDSLQWVDTSASNIEKQLAQVSRVVQLQKRYLSYLYQGISLYFFDHASFLYTQGWSMCKGDNTLVVIW